MISAIIPTYRNPDYLDLCLKSATENVVNRDTEIIVIVDGFVDESEEVIGKYPGVQVLNLVENRGMQYAINIGVSQATNPWVFVVNDDNVFPTEWDDRLECEVENCQSTSCKYMDGPDGEKIPNPKFVLSVNQVEPEGPGMFNHYAQSFGTDVDNFSYYEWLGGEKDISEDCTVSRTGGAIFPFIVSKKYFLAVGGMDTFYNSPNICDWDMFLKFELLDFWFPRTYAVHLYHFGSVVTKKNSEKTEFAQRYNNAMKEYMHKWGAHPHNEPFTNSKIPPDGQFRGFKV